MRRVFWAAVTATAPSQGSVLARRPVCVVSEQTSLCKGGEIDYDFVTLGRYPDMDCTTEEALDLQKVTTHLWCR